MQSHTRERLQGLVAGFGSLWLGALLLVLLGVAMGAATVFESWHGTEQALAIFYRSWWFELLLGLLALGIAAALVLRFPYSRKQIGFVLTHASVLVMLAGALVTERWGVDGQLALLEGETADEILLGRDMLFLSRRGDDREATLDLGDLPAGGLVPANRPGLPALSLGDVQVTVVRYLPDSIASQRVANDNPQPRFAVEVSFSDPHLSTEATAWVFADRTARVGSMEVVFREVDRAELEKLQSEKDEEPAEPGESVGTVRVEYQGKSYEWAVEDCKEKPVPVGETGYRLKVLRYMPHAVVGAGSQLQNASEQPINPTIEVELAGPEGTVKRPAFARFPEFWSSHMANGTGGPKVVFVTSSRIAPVAPISVLRGPAGKLYAHFSRPGQPTEFRQLTVGQPTPSPWPGSRLTVRRLFDHARLERKVDPVDPVRRNRTPAVLLEVRRPEGTEEVWLQRGLSHALLAKGAMYQLVYGAETRPLGFSVTLKDFHIGHYPGTGRPRSYESQITIADSATGRQLNRVISMNHPTSYRGYTFYQSSYQQRGRRMASILSVSRDPGQPIVFVGYLGTLAGMVITLRRRMASHHGASPGHTERGKRRAGGQKPHSRKHN